MYTLRITSAHARAVLGALDLYMRIAMGQTKEIGSVFEGRNGSSWEDQRQAGLDQVCEQLKSILFPDLTPGGYYGIMNEKTGRDAHLCYEVHCSLRHRVTWTENPLPAGAMPSTWHDTPILFPSGVAPAPECIAEGGKQPELEFNGYKLHRAMSDLLGTHDIPEAIRKIAAWKELVETEVCKTASKG